MLEIEPLVRAEVRKALELSPSDPMGHALLGILAALVDYDWKEAEQQFRLAKATEPVPPQVRRIYAAFYLTSLGHHEEALLELDKLIAQDPLDPHCAGIGPVYLFAGMLERSISESREAEAVGDRTGAPHCYMAQPASYWETSRKRGSTRRRLIVSTRGSTRMPRYWREFSRKSATRKTRPGYCRNASITPWRCSLIT